MYTITKLGQVFTACRDGEIPFVSADDVAEVAFHALTNETSYDRDLRVLGPELLTYDDVSSRRTWLEGYICTETPIIGCCQADDCAGKTCRARQARQA